MKKLLTCAFILFCFTACKTTMTPNNDSIIYLNSQNIKQLTTFNINSLVDSCSYIELETTDSSLIKEISKIQLSDSYIVILDKETKLYVFDRAGKFLNTIGRKGRAPGEYLAIRDFYIGDDGIIGFYDPLALKLHRYSLKGEYINSINIPQSIRITTGEKEEISIKEIYLTENNKLLCTHHIMDNCTSLYSLKDLSNDSMRTISALGRSFSLPNYMINFSAHPISNYSTSITFIKPFNDTIFEFSNETLRPKYIFDMNEDKEIPHDFLNQQVKNAEWETVEDIVRRKYINIVEHFETADNLILICIEDGKGKFICFNKNTQTGCYSKIVHTDSVNLPFRTRYTNHDGTFIDSWNASSVLRYCDKKRSNNEPLQGALQKLAFIGEDSNPVLVLRHLKKNWSPEDFTSN